MEEIIQHLYGQVAATEQVATRIVSHSIKVLPRKGASNPSSSFSVSFTHFANIGITLGESHFAFDRRWKKCSPYEDCRFIISFYN